MKRPTGDLLSSCQILSRLFGLSRNVKERVRVGEPQTQNHWHHPPVQLYFQTLKTTGLFKKKQLT